MKDTLLKSETPDQLQAESGSSAPPCSAINVIFDGPPGPEAGRFVEVETDDGKSINAGEWIDRGDGYWSLRITSLPNAKGEPCDPNDRR